MASFKDIITRIDDAVAAFIEKVPDAQREMLYAIDEELGRLELRDGKIKPTVANLKIITSIKSKMLRVVLTDKYKAQVAEFIQAFRDVTTLHNQYWKTVERKFKPSSILKQIKIIAIDDTVNKLAQNGLASAIQPISDMLTHNVTQGGSMKNLKQVLRESMTTTPNGSGILEKHLTQVATDSINQYSRNYTQIVSSDLGLEWFGYRNTLIKTSRPFCIAMVERRYFHVSEIPDLIKANDLMWKNPKTGKRERVPINKKTNLPHGMYPETNVANFLTLLGGYNCGHQAGPVSDLLVQTQDPETYKRVVNSSKYKAWKRLNAA
jgi:hypothetical protein